MRGYELDEIGCSPEECLSRVHPDDLDGLTADLEQLKTGLKDYFEREHRFQKNDGSWAWVLQRGHAVRDENGRAVRLVGCDSEISERKALEAKQEILLSVLEATSDFVGVASVDREILWHNKRLREFRPDLSSEAEKHDFADCHPDWALELMLKEAVPVAIREGSWSGEIALLDGEGKELPVSQVLIAHKGPTGEVEKFSTIMRDISEQKASEEALQNSERKYSGLASAAPVAIFRMDQPPNCIYVNERWAQMTGRPAESALGTGWMDAVHPDDRERLQVHHRRAVDREEPDDITTFESRLILQDGSIKWVHAQVAPEFSSDNRIVGYIGTLTDISERKSAQLALQEVENKFQRVAEHVPGVMYRFVLHPDGADEVTFVSPQVSEVYELSQEEALRSGLWSRVHGDDLEWLAKAVQESAATLEPFIVEFRLQLPVKGLRWCQCSALPIRLENGDVVWDGIVIDNTDKKTAEIELQKSQARFQRITENVPGMIYRYVWRNDGTQQMTYASSQSTQLFGLEPQVIIDDPMAICDSIHPDDSERVAEAHRFSAENQTAFKQEFRFILPNNQGFKWIQSTSQPHREENGDVVWDGVMLDVTQRKAAEAQLRLANDELATATKMKDKFLASMSHELRTPLNAILGMAEGLREGIFGPLKPKQMDSLHVIEDSGAHLLELINETLDLAKIESGQMELICSPTDVKELCDATFQFVEQQAKKKSLQLSLKVPWNLPEVLLDKRRIRQVLINLLANAVKFTQDHGRVSLAVQHVPPDGKHIEDYLRFTVQDSGVGISQSQLDSLFLPFVQFETELTNQHQGTGLGLALVKQFAELHGGHVQVTSQEGVGSRFVVEIPFVKSTEARTKIAGAKGRNRMDQSQLAPTRPHSNGKFRILLAEDNSSIVAAVGSYLRAVGYEVVVATDGSEAIERADQLSPDLILMDIQMPGIDGLSAISKIREISKHRETPVIAMTALAMKEDAERCIEVGANLYLSKPCRMETLVHNIRDLLQDTVGVTEN